MINEDFKTLGPTITSENEGKRIDSYLGTGYPFYSRADWQKRIKEGKVLVSGRKVRSSYHLRTYDIIYFFHPNEEEPEVNRNIQIAYEEDDVLAANKPSPLPMHENGRYRKNTFAELIKTVADSNYSAIHRLDRETSGIVLCGRTHFTRSDLARQFLQHKMGKTYLALVHGVPKETTWMVDAPLGQQRLSRIRIKRWVTEDGEAARTYFTVIAKTLNYSIVAAYPITGRTNQIRIHAAYSGHHLVGDKLYHPDEEVFLEYHDNGITPWVVEQVGHNRCCLHAASLRFFHPVKKEAVEVSARMADDVLMLWEQLSGEKSQPLEWNSLALSLRPQECLRE